MTKRLLCTIVAFFSICAFNLVQAWSFKEHLQVTRMAAARIINDPTADPALKAWLQQSIEVVSIEDERKFMVETTVGNDVEKSDWPGIMYFSLLPDINAARGNKVLVEPFNQPERLMHFIDLEYFHKDAPVGYKDDLSTLPPMDSIPHDRTCTIYNDAGFLPLSTELSYQQLVESFREKRLVETEGDMNNAVRWAGYLSHYLADNTQPHHATVDYKSVWYFEHNKKAPNIHNEVEWKLIDHPPIPNTKLRGELFDLILKELETFKDPVVSNEPFRSTLEVSYASYRYLPLIGRAAKATWDPTKHKDTFDTAKFFQFSDDVDGKKTTVLEMKARQLAWAVLRIERMFKQAWAEAQSPAKTPMTTQPTANPNP